MSRPRVRVAAAAVTLALAAAGTSAGTAYALWSTTATGQVQAQAATVGTPGNLQCSALVLVIRLSWSAPTTGPAPTSYVVESSSSANGSYTARQWLPAGTLSTDIGSVLGTGYYRVRASLAPAPTNPPNQAPATAAWVSQPTQPKYVNLLSLGCS